MENEEDELNKLRIENEIKKMKLSLEQGASFFPLSEKNYLPNRKVNGWIKYSSLKILMQKVKE